MVGVRWTAAGVCLLGLLAAQASAESRYEVRLPARSTAYAVKILLPNQSPIVAGAVAGPPSTYGSSGGFVYPEDGSIVSVGSVTGRATTDAGGPKALAGADLRNVVLFGGEVTAETVVARARASARTGVPSSAYDETQITNLVVLGRQVAAAPDLRVELGDWGHATLLQERERDAGRLHRGWVTVLDLRLDTDHAGLPVGTRILVGYAEASTRTPRSTAPAAVDSKPVAGVLGTSRSSTPTPRPRISRGLGLPADVARPGTDGPLPLVLVPPRVTSRLTQGGYVFPVFGTVGFSDTFGAPRAQTIWHHGADIFAQLGAPVLAVADGTVYSVGWNRLGGNRFWLRDRAGNEFYYAHLSAFAPSAINGARVRAGDVLGFVGNTGDAENTPYHLHFQIHPASMLIRGDEGVVNPTQYLHAWQRATDVAFPSLGVWAPSVFATKRAPAAGAILLQSSDISTASGLEPGSLARAIAPAGTGRDGAIAERGPRRSPLATR
jgi:murein DD-endopeptidase MepM/ murein hydrolase activator NlpD